MTAEFAPAAANPVFAAGSRFIENSREFSMFCKDAVQGLVSALMLIVGSGHMMTEGATLANLPVGLDGAFLENLLSGRTMGALEIMVAGLLFLSTRRGVARTLGVLALLSYIGFHNTGLSVDDLISSASSALHQIADALEMTSFSSPESAA
ncbi:MAG: hypothetical protein AAGJ87_04070 [Pseudomonadota bacterium]